MEPGTYLQHVLNFINKCWAKQAAPSDWTTSEVKLIFNKGDPADCGNYRPICLLNICHRLLMLMIKQRLLDAGVDTKLWHSQFGFRVGCSTEDAIYIARRRIELARAQRWGQVSLLALDWAKAFDSINTCSLIDGLRRFGLPAQLLGTIGNLLEAREFYVKDCGEKSASRRQRSGISQGCTLSPLLFIMVMSVLLQDADTMLSDEAAAAYKRGDLADDVYADDTLLISVSSQHLSEYLNAVAAAGAAYGMKLHWGKLQLLPVRCSPLVQTVEGNTIPPKTRMDYLGTILTTDAHDNQEI